MREIVLFSALVKMTLLEDFSEFYQLSGGECLNMAIFSKWRVFDGVALVENSVYRGGGEVHLHWHYYHVEWISISP